MFCPKCGAQNADGSSFCIACGQNLKETNEGNGTNEVNETGETQHVPVVLQSQKPNKKSLSIGLAAGGGILIVVLVVVMLFVFKSGTIQVGDGRDNEAAVNAYAGISIVGSWTGYAATTGGDVTLIPSSRASINIKNDGTARLTLDNDPYMYHWDATPVSKGDAETPMYYLNSDNDTADWIAFTGPEDNGEVYLYIAMSGNSDVTMAFKK